MMELKSLKRKKYQRYINGLVRDLNKNVENDWLWNGRFKITQKQSQFHIYEDHSGAIFHFKLQCKDMATGRIVGQWFESDLFIEFELWHWLNDCIIENFKVWDEKPDPYEQANLEGRLVKGVINDRMNYLKPYTNRISKGRLF